MKIYILKGWRYYDGETEVFIFDDPQKREDFQNSVECGDRAYEHQWELLDTEMNSTDFINDKSPI